MQNISVWIWTRTKMTIFDVIEKQQKSRFCLQFFLLKSSLQTQKSTFTAKFSPISSLEVIFFALILCWGRANASHSGGYWPCFSFQHHNCTACWEIARIFGSICSFPTYFIFILSPQPLRPTTEILRLLCSSVVANSKICRGRSRNSSVVKSQGYFILEWPFLQFHEQGAKFANEVDHLTCFFEKVDSQLPSCLMMLIRQPTKDEKWLWTYLTSRIRHVWAFIAIQRSKMTMSNVSSKLDPSVF